MSTSIYMSLHLGTWSVMSRFSTLALCLVTSGSRGKKLLFYTKGSVKSEFDRFIVALFPFLSCFSIPDDALDVLRCVNKTTIVVHLRHVAVTAL